MTGHGFRDVTVASYLVRCGALQSAVRAVVTP